MWFKLFPCTPKYIPWGRPRVLENLRHRASLAVQTNQSVWSVLHKKVYNPEICSFGSIWLCVVHIVNMIRGLHAAKPMGICAENHDFQTLLYVISEDYSQQYQLWPAIAMLQIQTLIMNFDENLFSFKKKTSLYKIRNLRCPKTTNLSIHLSASFMFFSCLKRI